MGSFMTAPSAAGTGSPDHVAIAVASAAAQPPQPKKPTFWDLLPECLFGTGIGGGGVGTAVTFALKSTVGGVVFAFFTVVSAAGCCYARKYRALKSVVEVTKELQGVDRDLERTAARADAATAALRPQVEAVGADAERLSKEREELDGLRAQLVEAQRKQQLSEQTLNQRIQDLSAANEQLKKEKQECQVLIESFRPQLQAFSQQNASFRSKLQAMGVDVQDMDAHEAQLAAVLSKEGANIKESAESLSKGVAGLQTSTDRLFAQLVSYTQALKVERERLLKNTQDFQQVTGRLQAKEQEIAKLQQQAEADQKALASTQRDLALVQQQLEQERQGFEDQLKRFQALQSSMGQSQQGWGTIATGIGASVDRFGPLMQRFQQALAQADVVDQHLAAHTQGIQRAVHSGDAT